MRACNTQEILTQLDQLIATDTILQHPFYQAWSAGALSAGDLGVYAWAYYPHVEAFPEYLREALKHDGHPRVMELLQENLDDELYEPEPHTELWLYFAEGLGILRDEVIGAMPLPEVQRSIDVFRSLCVQSPVSGLAALYTYESQQPEISRLACMGLREFYQIHDPQTLLYFTCHEEADVQHREDAREALRLCLEDGASSHLLFEAAQAALDAHWGLLDGVCRQAGVCC